MSAPLNASEADSQNYEVSYAEEEEVTLAMTVSVVSLTKGSDSGCANLALELIEYFNPMVDIAGLLDVVIPFDNYMYLQDFQPMY